MGPAPSASARDLAAARRHGGLLVGAEHSRLVEGLAHAARGEQIFRRQHARGAAPGDRLARQEQRLREVRAHEIEVVHGSEHGAPLAVPAPHEVEQIGRGLGIDGVERLVEHDHARVLQQ